MTKLYYTIFNLIALAAIIFVVVDSSYRIIRTQISQEVTNEISIKTDSDIKSYRKPPLRNYDVISKKNIFSKIEKLPEKEETPEIDTLESTTLKITLLGTMFSDQDNSAAVIEDKTKRSQGLYRIGDSIQNGIIKNILRGKIVLKVGDREEKLMMDEPTSSDSSSSIRSEIPRTPESRVPERTINVRRNDIDSSLANINDLLLSVSPLRKSWLPWSIRDSTPF